MKSRFDFAILYEGGTFSTFRELETDQVPMIGDRITQEIEGKQRQVEITDILGAVSFKGMIRTPVYGHVIDEAD
jgi:hypothetical protein